MQNADPITDRGDYAHNFDESGLIRDRIVEETLMGRNWPGAFRKNSMKLWRITFLSASCRREKISPSRCKKSSRNTPRERIFSSAGISMKCSPRSPLRTHRTRLSSSTLLSLPSMKFRICSLRSNPPKWAMDLTTTNGNVGLIFPKIYFYSFIFYGFKFRFSI